MVVLCTLLVKKTVKLWHWIALVTLTGIVPLVGISSYLIYNSINRSVRFTEQELRGDAFQRPLEQLLDLLPRYQAAARQALDNGEMGKQSMADVQRLLGSAFEALSANFKSESERSCGPSRRLGKPGVRFQPILGRRLERASRFTRGN